MDVELLVQGHDLVPELITDRVQGDGEIDAELSEPGDDRNDARRRDGDSLAGKAEPLRRRQRPDGTKHVSTPH